MREQKLFRLNWVLLDELAIGDAPTSIEDLKILKKEGISSILSLCDENEVNSPKEIETEFTFSRVILPDHRKGILPNENDLNLALNELSTLNKIGPVFVHCFAGKERSPLVCLGWLVTKHKYSPTVALDYLMQVHKGTNPLPGQLLLLNKIQN